MKKQIVHTFQFAHQPQIVWNYLTKPELVKQWLMPNDIKPVVGHKFEFTNKPIPSMNLDGHFHCEIIEVEPLKKLVYTWKGNSEAGKLILDTVVTWTLTKTDKGTELHLLHTGFTEDIVSIYDGMNGGWKSNVDKIYTLLIPVIQ